MYLNYMISKIMRKFMNLYSTNVILSIISIFQNWSNTDTKWVKDLILHKTYLKLKFTFDFMTN